MRAIAISEVGGPERLELMEIPVPVPGSDEVLVRVEAAGVNEVDTLLREGFADSGVRPLVMGSDFSGVIDPSATMSTIWRSEIRCRYELLGNGPLPKFAMPAAWVARKPTTISFEEAASLPCVGLTAYRASSTLGAGEVSDRGAAGGVDRRAWWSRARRGSSPRRVRATASTCWTWGPRPSWLDLAGDWVEGVRALFPGVSTRRCAAAAARRSVAHRRSCVTGDVSSGSRGRSGWATDGARHRRQLRRRDAIACDARGPCRRDRRGAGRGPPCNTSTSSTRPRPPRYASRTVTCGESSSSRSALSQAARLGCLGTNEPEPAQLARAPSNDWREHHG